MSVQTEVRCPHCNGAHAYVIGDAVITSRGPKGVLHEKSGRVLGCLHCGGNYAVTKTELIVQNRRLRAGAEPATGERKPVTPGRNGDRDIVMSPDQMV